jgi:hypothetical protein
LINKSAGQPQIYLWSKKSKNDQSQINSTEMFNRTQDQACQ